MRKRNIKIVAHWVIMSFVLLFPIVMVGISGFSKSEQEAVINYKYETNYVDSVYSLIDGNIYHFSQDVSDSSYKYSFYVNNTDIYNLNYNIIDTYSATSLGNGYYACVTQGHNLYYFDEIVNGYQQGYLVRFLSFDFVYHDGITNNLVNFTRYVSKCENVPIDNVDINSTITLRDEINSWSNEFINLPVNDWYKTLLNVIGIGFTNNSVMNVMYIYPLYVIWVYVLDVLVDIFLVIVKLGHNALERLGADND